MLGLLACRSAGAQDDCLPPPPPATTRELLVVLKEYPGAAGSDRSIVQTPDGRYWVEAVDLASWRLRPPKTSLEHAGRRWHALDAVSGLDYRFDACAQTLELDLSRTRRAMQRYVLASAQPTVPDAVSPGGFLNFDASLVQVAGESQGALLTEAGLFNDLGRGAQTYVLRDQQALRLDTYWIRDDAAQARTLRLGDAISRPGTWGHALRFGGVQWGTDFSLQPYVSTFPRPSIRGDAVLPSTVDVFVNDNLQGREETEPGPFELREVPTLSGAGELLAVVRDPLGRETRIAQPFYVSPSLLRRGLSDYGLDAGWVRRDYGQESALYGDFLATATLRQGVTDRFTRELRLEGQSDGAAVGANGLWLAGGQGLLSITGAYGQGRQRRGALFGAGFERDVSGGYSMGLSGQWAEPGFVQIGAPDDRPALRARSVLRLGMQPHPGGSFALAWAQEDRRDMTNVSVLSATYGLRLWRNGYVWLSATQTQADTRTRSAFLNFTWPLGEGANASAQQERAEGGVERSRMIVQGNPPGALGLGYRLGAERTAETARGEVSGLWRTERGALSGDVVEDQTNSSYRVGASTGIALLDGAAFWTRPVTGSFAVVRLEGLPNVDVYADNRLAGRTDASGRALIPDLRPYERNRLSVHSGDVPIEKRLDALTQVVVPPARSGVRVEFPLGEEAATRLRLRFADGAAVSAAARVRDRASGKELPVGLEGEIYLEGVGGRHRLDVRDGERQCTLDVELHAAVPVQERICEVSLR